MKEWVKSLAGDWPLPPGGRILDHYADVGEAWRCAQPGIKLWIAARLAPGWPERVRLLAATARAVTATLDWFDDTPVDRVPDVAGPLSRVRTQDDLPAYEEALDVLEHLQVLQQVVRSKIALAQAWRDLADPERRTEEAWRETAKLLRRAVADAYRAMRIVGPVAMPREAGEAILGAVDWVG